MTAPTRAHAELAASPWVQRWSHLVPRGARVLDVACGSGRHVTWFVQRGCAVTGVDRDAAAVATLGREAEIVVADIENASWPLAGRTFDAVVVTNYLWRPLLPTLEASLGPHGVLIYETFAQGQQSVGRPSNPTFLLAPGELLALAEGLHVVAYEHGFLTEPDRFVQRIVAIRSAPQGGLPARHALAAPTPPAGPLKSADHEESA